jgi:hypothetical protein
LPSLTWCSIENHALRVQFRKGLWETERQSGMCLPDDQRFKFKYLIVNEYQQHAEKPYMDLGGYFQILITILMTATFVTLILILLNAYYGKEEKETEKD